MSFDHYFIGRFMFVAILSHRFPCCAFDGPMAGFGLGVLYCLGCVGVVGRFSIGLLGRCVGSGVFFVVVNFPDICVQ